MSLAELQSRMEAAAAALDFEEASRLRDLISLVRSSGADPDTIDPTGLVRQQPGAMGLGTSQQRKTPPPGWLAPEKPDPMATRTGRKPKRG